jgi:nucleotide-binding universal stress UspA family protein
MERVLVAVDESDQSDEALEWALSTFGDAELVALHVIDPVQGGASVGTGVPTASEAWYEDAEERAETLLADVAERAGERGVAVETRTEVGRPATVIVEVAEDADVDHVVTGSHGRSGVSRILLGSVAETVVRRSPVPVTVVR